MNLPEEAVDPAAGRGTAAANLDLEEERTEGKAEAVAMPQLISVLEAMDSQNRWETCVCEE